MFFKNILKEAPNSPAIMIFISILSIIRFSADLVSGDLMSLIPIALGIIILSFSIKDYKRKY